MAAALLDLPNLMQTSPWVELTQDYTEKKILGNVVTAYLNTNQRRGKTWQPTYANHIFRHL